MPEPKKATIRPTACKLMEHATRSYLVTLPMGYDPADLLHPMNWANFVREFQAGTFVNCRCEDWSFDIDLRVIEVGTSYCRVKVLRTDVDIETPEITADNLGLRVQHNSVDKHRIIDKDGKILMKDIPTAQRARRELEKLAAKLRGETVEDAA
jgi:hypothetical protein